MRVLTVNAGSSSLKLRLLDQDDSVLADSDLATERGQFAQEDVEASIAGFPAPDAVGHRIVHGGERFRDPVRIDPDVMQALGVLVDLAPLHQPKSLAALEAVSAVLPDVPAVACFDTAFHTTIPARAHTYPIPEEWRRLYGLRRYGFHGLSHAYATSRAREMIGRDELRLVSCHLGAGASLAAIRDGRSIDTTMGFTPLEGLAMSTRSGSVDPGMLLWLLERHSLTVDRLAEALEHESGLRGLAGTADMREVLERSRRGDQRSTIARDVYVHRLRAAIASMAAAMGGIDALAFTGGVGENSPEIRDLAATNLGFLGVSVDPERNSEAVDDRVISAGGSQVTVLVISAREDLQIAHEVRRLLS